MPKRKKYPNLPNGYGTIRYLGKNRKNPYAVHPPCETTDDRGNFLRPKALCYVDDWYVGFAVLNAYHAGTYNPGDEILFKQYRSASSADLDAFCRRLLTDHSAQAFVKTECEAEKGPTFSEVYERFYEWKYGANAKKKLSEQSRNSTRISFNHCSSIHDRIYTELRHNDFQKCIDDCQRKSATKENIALLLKQMAAYAELYDIAEKTYCAKLGVPESDDEHGVPFTDNDLAKLWKNKEDPVVEMLLIMCYSGHRITEYKHVVVDLKEWIFSGGIKTESGKDRIVPVHTAIRPLVAARIQRDNALLTISTSEFRNRMYKTLNALEIEKHTPHDCRHTFSRLCEKYQVSENDRKRMLGHKFSDITNKVYGHRDLEDLKNEIEKIKIPICVQCVSSKSQYHTFS